MLKNHARFESLFAELEGGGCGLPRQGLTKLWSDRGWMTWATLSTGISYRLHHAGHVEDRYRPSGWWR